MEQALTQLDVKILIDDFTIMLTYVKLSDLFKRGDNLQIYKSLSYEPA